MMTFHFSKMQALGNDFMVIDGVNQHIQLTPTLIQAWSHRKRGVGFDQLLLIEHSTQVNCDFDYRIFNADGSEVAQCGNGARAIAEFVCREGLSDKTILRFKTRTGVVETERLGNGRVRVNMGVPKFGLEDVPAVMSTLVEGSPLTGRRPAPNYLTLTRGGAMLHLLSLGNPHAVTFVEDVNTAPVESLGAVLQNDPHFPEQVNVGFAHVMDSHHVKLRVYERGVGETEACGSGACAAMIAGVQQGLLSERVTVELPGGNLEVSWEGDEAPVFLEGGVEFVFEGIIKNDPQTSE